jgi:hypothetical protein
MPRNLSKIRLLVQNTKRKFTVLLVPVLILILLFQSYILHTKLFVNVAGS